MSATRTGAEALKPYASEPFEPSRLAFDRRNSKLAQLGKLRERCNEAVGVLTIDHEIDQIRKLIRDKAVDEEFSVAVRERWQNWSRNSNPFRSELASSAASELRSADSSGTDSDDPSDDLAEGEASEQEEASSPRKRKRKQAFRAMEIKVKVGASRLDVTEGWDVIRRDREAHLSGMDAALPSAFRFSERQLKVYAHRLKAKYINSLDRPFEVQDLHRLLCISSSPLASSLLHSSRSDSSSLVEDSEAQPLPKVFTVSFFSSSIDLKKKETASRNRAETSNSTWDLDGDSTRDDYVKRICGDGLGGMKRSQTIELLSTHTLLDLQSSLVCWSDGQPERQGWRKRLRRQISHRDTTGQGRSAETAGDASSLPEVQTSGQACLERDDVKDDEPPEVRFARFTGERRQTDAAFILEGKLFTKGIRHGDTAYEADYATLLEQWKKSTSDASAELGWSEKGGDLSLCLDQLGTIRIGQPYWMFHQGDCVHCLVFEQVRALRPNEQLALRHSVATTSVENAPAKSAMIRFPRVTWLSTPTMFRFAADNKDNYGIGHRILQWEGLLPFSHPELGLEAGMQRASQAQASMPTPWQIAMGRTRRKDEGLLRKKQGKCLSCSFRKARVGILGGDRVRLPLTSTAHGIQTVAQDNSAIKGLDDHLVTVCTSCAALLGLPTRSATIGPVSDASVELDWQRIETEKNHDAGWTVFPLY